MPTKRTLTAWVKYLTGMEATDQEMSQADFDSRCLLDIRDNLIRLNQGTEHIEGLAVERNETDRKMAQLVGIEPMSDEDKVQAIDNYRAARDRVRGLPAPPIADLSGLPMKRDATDWS